jgi:hypothetical protein
MKLFFAGAEVPGYRSLLAAERVPAVSLSFVGLSRRIKKLNEWRLADKFPADPGFRQELFVDSGAYSLNKAGADYTDVEAIALAAAYFTFVANNLGRIDMYSEFDALLIDPKSREDARQALHELAPGKFMPIWHAEYGVDELERLADRYERVGVLQPADDAMGDLSPVLRRISAKTKLHGVAMTRMAAMKAIPWDSVGSTSWLSPGQYGDTFVWAGGELHRYPVKYREQARKRHRTQITDAGFDSVAVARDATDDGTPEDRKEVLRLSLWSWGQFVDDINRHGATHSPDSRDDANEESGEGSVGNSRGRSRNAQLVPTFREKTLLPVLSLTQEAVRDSDGVMGTEAQVGLSQGNLMRCDTCFARDKCPEFQPGAECAYKIPMIVTTSTQARALRKLLLGMQGQRVLTMRLFEQFEGGYADPNLSAEMRLLQKMLADDIAADRDHASVSIQVTTDGNSGFISRMFGGEAEQRVNALAQPVDASKMIEGSGIVDADWAEDSGAR